MYNLEHIFKSSKLHSSRIHNIYLYGSRVYGTHQENSDYDVILVANNSVESTEIKHPIYNIHILTPDKFQEDLNWHRPNALECYYALEENKLQENFKFEFKLDKNKLRHSISHTNSNSYVKAKKKLLQGDYHLGIKSLFHSLRIPMMAIQICEYGKIVDFQEANPIWLELQSKKWSWSELESRFRDDKNKLMTKFRLLAEKK